MPSQWRFLSVGFAEPCRLQWNKRVGKYANRAFCGKRDKKWVTSSKSYAKRDLFNDVAKLPYQFCSKIAGQGCWMHQI